VREVRVRLASGKVPRLLCNDFDATAAAIADLYKRRWAIELFFRRVKQTLEIRRFLVTSGTLLEASTVLAAPRQHQL
jgi:IS4 transposase